jgi:hypothetical protein
MKLKVTTNKDALETFTGDSYISKSGVYDVVIKFASISVSKNGAESVNFNVDYKGNSVTLYGPYYQDKEGKILEIGAKIINNLAVIAGMSDGDDYIIEEEEHAVGKDKKVQTFSVITNFTDLPVKVHVQEEYSINPNTNEIRKSLVIKNFFREDGASAKEVVTGKDIGKQLALIEEKYADKVTYKDNLTPEMVEEWKASKAKDNNKNAPAKTAPKVKSAPAGSLFV